MNPQVAFDWFVAAFWVGAALVLAALAVYVSVGVIVLLVRFVRPAPEPKGYIRVRLDSDLTDRQLAEDVVKHVRQARDFGTP